MHFLSIPLTCALDTRQLTGYHINSIPLLGAEHTSYFYIKLAVGLSLCANRKAARSPSLRKQEGLFVSHIFRDTNNPSVTCRYVWAFQN